MVLSKSSKLRRLASALLWLLAVGCDGNDKAPSVLRDGGAGVDAARGFTYRAMLENLVDEVVLVSYDRFLEETRGLNAAARGFCGDRFPAVTARGDGGVPDGGAAVDAGTSGVSFAQLRQRYVRARDAWKACDAFAFGPYLDAPYRIGPKLDSYPVRVQTLNAFLVDEIATPETVALQGTGKRGLPVVELLLYEQQSAELDELSFSSTGGDQRCAYLTSLTADIEQLAGSLVGAWRQDFASEVKLAGHGSRAFPREHDAVSEIVNRLVFMVENIRESKLLTPAGLGGDEPLPGLFESQYSHRSARDAESAILGLQRFYEGSMDPAAQGGGFGLRDALHARESAAERVVAKAIADVVSSLSALESFEAELETEEFKLSLLHERLKSLQLALGVDLAAALAVSVTFNDTDGD